MPRNHCCKNHPQTPAIKRCFFCKDYICESCQIHFTGQLFCSFRCLAKATFDSIFLLLHLGEHGKAIRWKNLSPGHFLKHIQRWFIWLAIGAIFLAFWISLQKLHREIKNLPVGSQMTAPSASDSSALILSKSLFAKNVDAMVLKNSITIQGESSNNIIISLKINGQLREATVAKNKRFTFENVHLDYGNNEIIVLGTNGDGETIVLEKLTTVFGAPRIDFLARDFSRGEMTTPQIALTFDGGSGDGATEKILQHLAQKNVRCTMFLTGQFLTRYPNQVRDMVQGGHEIGNHTWSHPHLTTFAMNRLHNTLPHISSESLQNELNKTAELFFKLTGTRMAPYWRAPFGEHNLEIRRWAAEVGYHHVGWTMGNGETMDTMDWIADSTAIGYHSSQSILQKLLKFGSETSDGANGSIILMHLDTQRARDPVHEIIPALIDSMRQRGYEFVTVSKLMRR